MHWWDWATSSLGFGDILQKLKVFGDTLHGIYAIPIVAVGAVEWLRVKFFKHKAKEAQKLIDRIEKAAEQKDEESIWSLSPPRPPVGYSERVGGLGIPIIAVGNLKGGVGKTTTSAYLAYCLSNMGLNVLAVDLDYQGSLSNLLLKEGMKDTSGVDKLLSTVGHQVIFSDDVIQPITEKISLITASSSLSPLENRLMLRWLLERDGDDIRYRLAAQLMSKKVRDEFNVILLDTPPRMTMAAFNAFMACSHVVIPTSLKYTSWDRVPAFYRLLKNIAATYNSKLQVAGIALTLTNGEPPLRGTDAEARKSLENRLVREGISCPIFSRHIPRWNALGGGDFDNRESLGIYGELAEQVWEKITPNQRKAA